MNFQNLTDDQLHSSNQQKAAEERRVTLELLRHLAETERRHLFSKYECDSLHAYCVKYLKMSDPQSGRRVAASRLLRELPVLEEKVQSGAMNLSTVCQVSSFFKKEAHSGNKYDHAEKLEILEALDNQSCAKVGSILMAQSADPKIHFRDSVKQKTEAITEVKLNFDQQTMKDLNRLKEIWSHALPGASLSELIKRAVKHAVDANDPARKAERALQRKSIKKTSLAEVAQKESPAKDTQRNIPTISDRSRYSYIPATVKDFVWFRDGGKCTFVNSSTGECCDSRRQIEFDHKVAVGRGGKSTPENLRLRCRAHNHRNSITTYGFHKANQWRS